MISFAQDGNLNKINEVNYAVTQVIEQKNGQNIGTASGFFYKNKNIEYLITNRHVVLDSLKSHFPDKLQLKTHADKNNLSDNYIIEIVLFDNNGKRLWLEHPDYYNKKCDIVAIPLTQKTLLGTNYNDFIKSKINTFSADIQLLDKNIQSFGNAIVIGYPLGNSDVSNNLPIYRNAMIASEYGINFNGRECFLIDARLHKGTSGSPVINSPNNILIENGQSIHSAAPILLGILSAGNEELGLNFVWYPYLIDEIINNKKNMP